MLPAYGPEPFQNLDLRKYHVRDIKDVLRFIDFAVTRLDESKHILNKFNTRYNTLDAVVKQMQKQQQKISDVYGAPEGNKPVVPPEEQEKAVIQESKEDLTAQKEREALLDDLRQAAAEERLAEALEESEDRDGTLRAEFEKYKAAKRENDGRVMFDREGKMVKASDVPEDIKTNLLAAIESTEAPTEE